MWMANGSRAANIVFADFYRNVEHSDWDVLTTKREFSQWLDSKPSQLKSCYPVKPGKFHLRFTDLKKMELAIYDDNQLYQFVEKTPEIWHSQKLLVPHIGSVTTINAKCLTLLKKSHLSWNIHWEKNNEDYQWMKNQCDLNTLEGHEILFYQKAFATMSERHKDKPLREVAYSKLKI